MTETLPMLEEHPFVARYAWMSALTDTDVMLNNKTTFELNELGELYNQYVWDKSSYHNQQWAFIQTPAFGKTMPFLSLKAEFLYLFKISCDEIYTIQGNKPFIANSKQKR